MDSAVVAALVAGAVSLFVTFGKVAWDARRTKQQQRLEARERLDRYRAPLLAAVDDLGRRVNNVRNDGFLGYLDVQDRRGTALLSTLFRLAQYLGWVEIIYGRYDQLRFDSDKATKAVAETLGDIGWILAADEFDRTDESDFTTSRLMLWREEQRAIGEHMRLEGDKPGCIGYGSFTEAYETHFSRWFARFAAHFEDRSAAETNRLAELHRVLARLLRQLDVDHARVELDTEGKVLAPRWAQPSALPAPTKHTRVGAPHTDRT